MYEAFTLPAAIGDTTVSSPRYSMKPDSPWHLFCTSVPGEDGPSLGLFSSQLSRTKKPDHIFAAFCSAASVAIQTHQNITTVDLRGIWLKQKSLCVWILCTIPITYPLMALGWQYLIILLKQASIFLTQANCHSYSLLVTLLQIWHHSNTLPNHPEKQFGYAAHFSPTVPEVTFHNSILDSWTRYKNGRRKKLRVIIPLSVDPTQCCSHKVFRHGNATLTFL